MDDFFKARIIWCDAILSLTDSEAGRLMKAVWKYVTTGTDSELNGQERVLFRLIKSTLDQDKITNER